MLDTRLGTRRTWWLQGTSLDTQPTEIYVTQSGVINRQLGPDAFASRVSNVANGASSASASATYHPS